MCNPRRATVRVTQHTVRAPNTYPLLNYTCRGSLSVPPLRNYSSTSQWNHQLLCFFFHLSKPTESEDGCSDGTTEYTVKG